MCSISSGRSARRKGSVKSSINAKRELVRSALRMHGGNKLKAAKELGISRCYLHRLLNQLRIVEFMPEEEDEVTESREPAIAVEGFRLSSRAM